MELGLRGLRCWRKRSGWKVCRRWRSVGDPDGVVHSGDVHLGRDEGNGCFTRQSSRDYGWDAKPDDGVRFPLRIDAQWVYSGRVKELETAYPLRSRGLCEDGGDGGGGVQLAQGSFVTVIGLVLRDEDHVRLGYVGEILDAGGTGMAGEEELGVPHGGRAGDPWVDEDGEDAWRLVGVVLSTRG